MDLETPTDKVLKSHNLTDLLIQDSFTLYASDSINKSKQDIFHLKNVTGSFSAILAATFYRQHVASNFFVLDNKEEAFYFYNDLKELLPDSSIYFFPISYKQPYAFTKVENANVLQRSELINKLIHWVEDPILIVTYSDALCEKVLSKKELTAITLALKVSEEIDLNTLVDMLLDYNFEKVDFVYEPGQFAIRGGIIDIYSFSYKLPYRIELFDDTIESIRTFDPISQSSQQNLEHIVVIPDLENKTSQEERIPLLTVLPPKIKLWFKDLKLTLEVLEQSYEIAHKTFEKLLKQSNKTQIISEPSQLFENKNNFLKLLKKFTRIEFGKHFYYSQAHSVLFNSHVQPSFNKNYELLFEDLEAFKLKGYTIIITAQQVQQLEKLKIIFEELNSQIDFKQVKIALSAGFYDHESRLVVYTDHQIFNRLFIRKPKKYFSKKEAISFKAFSQLKIGDYVTHIDYGIARYTGLHKININGNQQEVIRLVFKNNDLLYVNIHALYKLSKYRGQEDFKPPLAKLGSDVWEKKKNQAKRHIKDIAKDLIQLYAKRKEAQGFCFTPDNYLIAELESSFIFEETPDQSKAIQDVKFDLEQPYPMDRLICGDVGFGKTEVAIRAAFKVICDSKQVAILAPTTILALQHYKTFSSRLENLPCTIDYVNRFRSAKQIKNVQIKLQEGKIDLIIGTHKLLGKGFEFKDLGLIIIDEEQKFGVAIKEKLKQLKVNVDTLTLTATPIPRTLNFSLMGARDLSIINTPPSNRLSVQTTVDIYQDSLIRDAIKTEIERSGQIFVIHNRVKDLEGLATKIINLVPDVRIAVVHGQLPGERLEKIMLGFINYDYDVLVCTNIIESGLDISNVNTIIINNAHYFGLSDLHQMRGRVGRSNRQAYCYLLVPNLANISQEARKRLTTLEEFSDLGEGFKIAMRDLEIRGAGNLLGAEQSGFINDMGLETYQQILGEAVKELKDNEFKELFESKDDGLHELKFLFGNCTVETDLEILIPENYIANANERLNLYLELDKIKDEMALEKFQNSLSDKYGKYPKSIDSIFKILKIKWLAQDLGIEKLVFKKKIVKLFLPNNKNKAYYSSEQFTKILNIIKKNENNTKVQDLKSQTIIFIFKISNLETIFKLLE